MTPILYIPVGIPGCGKSTMARRVGGPPIIVSTDLVRQQLGKPPGSVDQEVFDTYHATIRQALALGHSVYADATNLRAFAREDLAGIATEVGAETHLIVFRNVSEAILRNGRRTGTAPGEGPVPPEAMLQMIEQYERALVDIPGEVYNYVTEVSSVR